VSRRDAPARRPPAHVQTREWRETACGPALYVRVFTPDYAVLAWREVWEAFAEAFPGKWGVQSLPPPALLVDEENVYHLLVFDDPPAGFDLFAGRR